MQIKNFKQFIHESKKSDEWEKYIADSLNMIHGVNAERPKVSAKYSDVLVTLDSGEQSWLEVKMNHTDNLSNPRVFFDGKKWDTTYTTYAAQYAVNMLNKSSETKKFIESISKFSGIKNPKIPTNKGGLKDKNSIPLDVMKDYFSQPGINRYILLVDNVDIGKIVTEHYVNGKIEPAYYMQAADDFYLISKTNPLKLDKKIPLLKGKGMFKVRVSTRSQYYEVQAEIKIVKLDSSKYSVLPNTSKINPFIK